MELYRTPLVHPVTNENSYYFTKTTTSGKRFLQNLSSWPARIRRGRQGISEIITRTDHTTRKETVSKFGFNFVQPKPNAVVTKELKWRKKLHEQKGYIFCVLLIHTTKNWKSPEAHRKPHSPTIPLRFQDSNLRKKHDRINTYQLPQTKDQVSQKSEAREYMKGQPKYRI